MQYLIKNNKIIHLITLLFTTSFVTIHAAEEIKPKIKVFIDRQVKDIQIVIKSCDGTTKAEILNQSMITLSSIINDRIKKQIDDNRKIKLIIHNNHTTHIKPFEIEDEVNLLEQKIKKITQFYLAEVFIKNGSTIEASAF